MYENLDDSGWLATDELDFHVDSIVSEGLYELSIGIRTSSTFTYPYRQLTMEVCQLWNAGERRRVDTLNCVLSKNDGEVKGRGVAVYSYEFPVDSLLLSQGDSAQIKVRHLMRRTPLPGIYNVGVLLKHFEK